MYFRLTACICLSLITSLANASEKAYQLPVTRDGNTTTRVAHYFWAGEYPAPVINVMAGKEGYYTAHAYKSLRELNNPVTCSIKKGLYHPWSKTPNSVINFYTIAPRDEITATKDTTLDSNHIRKGQTIINIIGAGEGYCTGEVDGKVIDYFCDNADTPAFAITVPSDEKFEQWLYVQCREGYRAFIQDEALLKSKGVTRGKIKSYGEITP